MQHSEYQKRYRPVGPSVVESHYAQLLAYRRARRCTEASHHRWAWAESASDSDSKEEQDLSDVEEQPEEEKVAKRLSRSPQRNGVAQRNGALVTSEEEEGEEEEAEEEAVAARLKRLALRRALEKEREGRPQKPRHPKNRIPIPKPVKSKEAPQESRKASVKAEAGSRENPMFVLYGRGNRQGLGTFNVRSDRDVHASAVRANRRRQAEIERRRSAKLVVPARERKDPAKGLARQQMQRETAGWQSEYQKNFPTYEMACYRRSLANLTPRPVSAMI